MCVWGGGAVSKEKDFEIDPLRGRKTVIPEGRGDVIRNW